MFAVSVLPHPFSDASVSGVVAFTRRMTREGARLAVVAAGTLMVIAGFPLALLPGHFGLFLLVIGLILMLRNSPKSRRKFIRLQHRHPRVLFPVRRLIRRNPEIVPVMWQQALRIEKIILPAHLRRAGAWRRRYFRAAR
jgi:hypothetical protein